MPNVGLVSSSDRAWRAIKKARTDFGSAMIKSFTREETNTSKEVNSKSRESMERVSMDSTDADIKSQLTTHDLGIPENDNPLRRRIHSYQRKFNPFAKIKGMYYLLFPPLTEQDIEKKREFIERKKLQSLLKSETRITIQRFHNVFRRMQLSERPLANQKGTTGRVWFDVTWANPNSIYIHIGKFPFGTNILDFVTEAVTTNLGESIRRTVTATFTISRGIIYRIDRNSIAGLPNLVTFQENMKAMSASLPPLAFPIGRIANGKHEYANIDDGPHILIGGETKGGKSNMLNVIIGSILWRTTPADVRMMMVDLKGNGIELSFWEDIPQLIKPEDVEMILRQPVEGFPKNGIAAFPEQALAILEAAEGIANKRMNKYTKAGVKNIDQWNAKHRAKRDYHLLILIDEWTMVTDYTPARSRALLKGLAAIARAAGVHVIAALQTADKTTFTQNMKTNFAMRIAFAFQDVSGSVLMVGDSSAINLEPAGRAIFKHGTRRFMVQSPFISNDDIKNIVRKAKGEITGDAINFSQIMVTEDDVLSWALVENDGDLVYQECYTKFKGKIEQAQLKKLLRSMDNKTFNIGEHAYLIEPAMGSRCRKVTRVTKPMGSPQEVENPTQNTT